MSRNFGDLMKRPVFLAGEGAISIVSDFFSVPVTMYPIAKNF